MNPDCPGVRKEKRESHRTFRFDGFSQSPEHCSLRRGVGISALLVWELNSEVFVHRAIEYKSPNTTNKPQARKLVKRKKIIYFIFTFILDSFPNVFIVDEKMKRKISKQTRYQLKHVQLGLCRQCPSKADRNDLCNPCRKSLNIRCRNAYRRKHGIPLNAKLHSVIHRKKSK